MHASHARGVRPLLVLAACVAATGCGGSADTDSTSGADADATQSLASFREQAKPICTRVSAANAKTTPPSSFPADPKDFETGAAAVLKAIEEDYTELAELDPPTDMTDEFEEFADALDGVVASARAMERLVEAENFDTDALWLPLQDLTTYNGVAMERADDLGLDACTTLDFKEAE